jgi:FtsZ-binding cell division protein ZapB
MENQNEVMAANLNAATIRINTLVDTISNLNFMIKEYKAIAEKSNTLLENLKRANHSRVNLEDSFRKATAENISLYTRIEERDIATKKLTMEYSIVKETNDSLNLELDTKNTTIEQLEKKIEGYIKEDIRKCKVLNNLSKDNWNLKNKKDERGTS